MQYSTGTISITGGTNVVTGTGTEWLTGAQGPIVPGDLIVVDLDEVAFEVSAVNSDTELELTANYPTNKTDVDYAISRDFTPFLNLPLLNQGDLKAAVIISKALKMIDNLVVTTTDPLYIGTTGRAYLTFNEDYGWIEMWVDSVIVAHFP